MSADRFLNGNVAVITGAGSGIGQALALHLARNGCTVAAVDWNATALESTVEQGGAGVTGYHVDMSDAAAVWALAAKVIAELGAVDLVVNNAGIGLVPVPMRDRGLEHPSPVMERIRTMVEVNALGVVHGSLAFLPTLLSRPRSYLANVASDAGLVAFAGAADYSLSKFAVRGFTEGLQMECSGSPLRVSMVYPGATRTQIMRNSPMIAQDERAELQSSFDRMKGMMSPEAAAAKIVKGLERGKPRILLHPTTHGFSVIGRIAPGLYPRLLAPVLRRLEGSLERAKAG